jgi:putative transposase
MIKTIKHANAANVGKLSQVAALFPFARRALKTVERREYQQFLTTGELCPKFLPSEFVLDTPLSARYVQNLYCMVYEAVSSWEALLQDAVRKTITDSALPDETKTVLYRLNSSKQWYAPTPVLAWAVTPTGEIVTPSKNDSTIMHLPVDVDDLRLLRTIVKHCIKHLHRPRLDRVRTLKLNATVADVQSGRNSFSYWVKLSTLTKGKPVMLPLVSNPFFNRQKNATLKHQIQISIDGTIALIIEQPNAPARTSGDTLGLDWGVNALFATSDGRLLGRKMLERLRQLDHILEPYTADLQRRGIKLKTDPYYQKLQNRTSSFVKNEVGRILNQLATENIKIFAVEKLDFRHGGLSRRMNRIVSRAGRATVRTKLKRLNETHGIITNQVNPAYTSQECAHCHHTERKNRTTQARFKCHACGHKISADINAAQNIYGRSINNRSWLYVKRKTILQQLDTLHETLTKERLRAYRTRSRNNPVGLE